MFRTPSRRFALALLAGLLPAFAASAQQFPNKPITLIVPFAPGGGTDAAARSLGDKMSDILGQRILVQNRDGAGGMIGTAFVAHAPADGYTLVMGTQGTHGSNESLFKDMTYRTIEDFSPVVMVASTALMLIVKSTLPVENLQQFLAYAKSRDNVLYGSTAGQSPYLAMEMLKMMTGAKATYVPFRGQAPARTALLSSDITVMFDNIPSLLPLIEDGSLRALAVSGSKRDPSAPKVPTVAEAGIPGFEMLPWYALFAPAGTPAAVIEKLNAAANQALKSPELTKTFQGLGLNTEGGTAEELGNQVKSDVKKYRELIAAIGLEKQ